MRGAVWAVAAASLTVPAHAQEQDEHPRSYYPTLTTADLAVCRVQFATLQADVVEHYRRGAANAAPGGGWPSASDHAALTERMNEIAAKSPVTFYADGLRPEGEIIGDLGFINGYWDDGKAADVLAWAPTADPASALDDDLYRAQNKASADHCVSQVWTKKFNAMHASATATRANPAVWSLNESLTPLSIGSSNAPAPPGKDAHIIASNGKSAMTCVKLVRLAKGDSKLTGIGGRVLSNQCSDAVEAGWCYSPGDCDTEHGSSWTIRSGRSWPVQSAGTIRWAACHGANTQSFVKGSHGLRYYCSAPK